jgi:hypothetical protein
VDAEYGTALMVLILNAQSSHRQRRGKRLGRAHFDFDAMLGRVEVQAVTAGLGQGTHFLDVAVPWNQKPRKVGAGGTAIIRVRRLE